MVALLQENTDLTRQIEQLTVHVHRLTSEIHEQIAGSRGV
jgi:hypothetical protein